MDYTADDVSPDMSFLEMLDVVNEGLIGKGEEPIAFDSDCREGICGTCGLVVNGMPHGPDRGTTVCQLHMRRFKDGDTITHRAVAGARPSRSSRTWSSIAAPSTASSRPAATCRSTAAARPTATRILIPKDDAEHAMDAAACIGCGACVAACQNASAALFTSRQDHPPRPAAAGPGRARPARRRDGRSAGCRRVRQLLERRRVRGGLPEGDLDLATSRG